MYTQTAILGQSQRQILEVRLVTKMCLALKSDVRNKAK